MGYYNRGLRRFPLSFEADEFLSPIQDLTAAKKSGSYLDREARRRSSMPYISSYVDDGKGLLKKGSGIVTGAEMFAVAMKDPLDEKAARKLHYGLVDFSEVTDMQVTPTHIRQLVEINRKMASLTPGALVAVIAPDPMSYAISRLWHSFAEDLGWKANVFHARPDAIAWLRKQLLAKDDSDPELSQYPSLKQE